MDNNAILQSVLGQAGAMKPQFGMPPQPPQTGNMGKDMALAMLLYGGLLRGSRVPRATFSNQKPPTSLSFPANDTPINSPMSAGPKAGALANMNSSMPADIRGRIPEPGNLNTPPASPNGGLPPNQTPGIHNAVLDMLRKFIPGQ